MGSGLINLMQQGLGGTMGLAIMTTILQRRTTYHANALAQEQVASSLPWVDVMAPLHAFMRQAGEVSDMVETKALALVQRHLTEQATVAAYQDCFILVVILILSVCPFVFFMRRR
jgi:DHA2 family multidrug resistance protein